MDINQFLIGFLLGVVVCGVAVYLAARSPVTDAAPLPASSLSDVMATQVVFQQQQNMLRAMQLEQYRQEAEFRALEKQRAEFIADAHKPDYALVSAAVSREIARQGAGVQC